MIWFLNRGALARQLLKQRVLLEGVLQWGVHLQHLRFPFLHLTILIQGLWGQIVERVRHCFGWGTLPATALFLGYGFFSVLLNNFLDASIVSEHFLVVALALANSLAGQQCLKPLEHRSTPSCPLVHEIIFEFV